MTNLLIVYSNLGLGGIPKKIVDILNWLNKKTRHTHLNVLLQKETGFSLVQTIRGKVRIDYFQLLGLNKPPLLFVFRLMKVILARRPTTILAFVSSYAIPVLLCKYIFFWRPIRIIIGEDHMTSTMIRSMKFPFIQSLGIRLLYPGADKILTPTRAIKQNLIESFSIPRHIIDVIPNWTIVPKTFPQKQRPVDIIYAGRFDTSKNLLTLLSVVLKIQSLHTNVRAVFLGDGPEKQTLTTYISAHKLNNNVSVLPPATKTAAHLQTAKILLFTSGDTEGMPLVLIEAMAHGCVVVSLPFRGAEEFIQDKKTGFLPQTPEAMARLAVSLLTNDRLRGTAARSAYIYVKKYHSAQNVCRNYVEKLV